MLWLRHVHSPRGLGQAGGRYLQRFFLGKTMDRIEDNLAAARYGHAGGRILERGGGRKAIHVSAIPACASGEGVPEMPG